MVKHSLVHIRSRYIDDDSVSLGVVLDYRPDVLGGTGVISWRRPSSSAVCTEIQHHEKRGEVLVMNYSDGSLSWYDELSIIPVDRQTQAEI